MQKELNTEDILYFPKNLVFKVYGEDLLVVSPYTANWIVINKSDKDCLDAFIAQKSIGSVLAKYKNNGERVLAAILAQKFAGINEDIHSINLHEFTSISLLLTNKCNLRCKHCYLYSGVANKNELELEDWKKLILDCHENGINHISFSGGEPLVFDDLLELLKYAKSFNMKIMLYSNGLLWTDQLIEEYSKYVDSVQISLDGYDENTNSVIRGKDHFDKALDTIMKLSKYNISVNVATTLDTSVLNDETKYKYAELVNKIRKNNITFALTKRFIKGRHVNLTVEENDKYEKKVREISEFVNDSDKTRFITSVVKNGVIKNCGIGCLTVDSCGNVYGCNRIEQMKSFGNVKDNLIKYYIEQGKQMCEDTSVDNLDECKDCHLRYICGGGCKLDDCDIIDGKFIHKKCTDVHKETIERKMLNSFNEYYKF